MRHLSIKLRLAALAVLLALGAESLAYAVTAARHYTVRPGETLGSISQSVGVPVYRLVDANNLPDADHILAGQTLLVPDDGATPPTSAPASSARTNPAREYVVQPGDSLSGIAAEHGVSIAALIEANSLADPNRLAAGQRLVLPSSADGAPRSATAPPAATAPAGASSEVGALLDSAATRYKLDPVLVKALAWYLSSWRPDATSPTGAVGVMQLTGGTQEWVAQTLLRRAADRGNVRDNVELGVAYLAYLVGKFGDERQGVAAYLQGPASLTRGGPGPTTTRALETIYAARARFTGGGGGSQARTATPGASPTVDLAGAVQSAARGVAPNARIGVSGRNLTTGERFDIRGGEVFPSASVNKVAILAEAHHQLQAGLVPRSATLIADLDRMITISDNDAANRLLDRLGERQVNGFMASLGLGNIVHHNYYSAGSAPRDPGFNQTTPAETAALLGLLASDRLVSAAASREMRDQLLRTYDPTKLLRGVPAGTPVAHKSGWYDGVANDVGIIFAPRANYVLAVFTQGTSDHETGNQLVAAISRTVYDAWGR